MTIRRSMPAEPPQPRARRSGDRSASASPARPPTAAHVVGPGMFAAVQAALGDDDANVMVRPVQCLSVCKRPATVAVSSPDGYTFLFGDLQTESGTAALSRFVKSYRNPTMAWCRGASAPRCCARAWWRGCRRCAGRPTTAQRAEMTAPCDHAGAGRRALRQIGLCRTAGRATAGWRGFISRTATAGDDEMRARIAHHRAQRGDGWTTIEEPLALVDALTREAPRRPRRAGRLPDAVALQPHACRNATPRPRRGGSRDLLRGAPGPVVLVSNEVGLGLVPGDAARPRAFATRRAASTRSSPPPSPMSCSSPPGFRSG